MSKDTIVIPQVVTVKELSDLIGRPVNDVITTLVRFGVMANINQDIDFDTASIVADEFGIQISEKSVQAPEATEIKLTDKAITRPPVITIMGHVDHGKTTLLDALRDTNVAAGEAGGITQAISSYQVNVTDPENKDSKRLVTFVDTPGHSAFEAMRRHGASITDLVILVVAASEGVKPQTKEAIKHAQAMNVPIVVAINKVDLPNANIEKTKRELSDVGLVTEEWGGKTPMVEISATKKTGLDKLLEVVLLATDLLDLKADPTNEATGVVIESHMEGGMGPVATVLIQNGTLNIGQAIVIGDSYGKVRTIEDHRGKRLRQATASMPIRIAGLSSVPAFGQRLIITKDEKEARLIARQNAAYSQKGDISKRAAELTEASKKVEGRTELNLVIKTDTQGSLNAITELLNNLSNEDVQVKILKGEVGELGEQDIQLANTAHASVLVFNHRINASIKQLAQERKVQIHSFKVIYELEQLIIETVKELMPEIEIEREVGVLEILRRFRDNRKHPVLGGSVSSGSIKDNQKAVINRGEKEIAKGDIVQVRVGQQQVKEVKSGSECGLELKISEGDPDEIKTGDILRVIVLEKVKKTL